MSPAELKQWASGCLAKRRYATEELAKRTGGRNEARCRGLKLYVYSCPHCFGYHLTRQRVWQPRKGEPQKAPARPLGDVL